MRIISPKLLIQACFLVLLSFLYITSAHANISVDKVVVHFDNGRRPVENIIVTNTGERPLMVKTKIVETLKPGQTDEEEISTRKVIVAPQSFTLAPGEKRTARIVLREMPQDMEAMYRVRFFPSTIKEKAQETQQGMSIKLNVLFGMGVLLLAAPQNPEPNFTAKRENGKIIVTNNGNVTVQLNRERFCDDDGECVQIPGKRVYPGMTWTTDIPKELRGKPFSQTIRVNNDYQTYEYAP